jgi:predicted kinase
VDAVTVPENALVILVGPSGCGKSTFARRSFRETEIVSSDACRRLVSDDEANQAATPQAFAVFHALIRGRLSLGRLTVADATNLIPHARAPLRAHAARFGAPTVVLVLDVPLEVCLEQARGRARHVRPEVILHHYEIFLAAKEALGTEGYDAVYVVGSDARVEVGPPLPKPAPPSAPAAEAESG